MDNTAEAVLNLTPTQDAFTRAYDEGIAQVVWTRLVADLETPVSAYMKLVPDRGPSFLLESIEGGESRGRYSIIGHAPDIIWRAEGEKAWINRSPQSGPDAFEVCAAPTLKALRDLLAESTIDLPDDLPPMAAGVFGYMGFDTVRLVEHLLEDRERAIDVPDALMIRPTLIVIFDTVKDELTIVTPVRGQAGITAADAYENARARLAGAVRALERPSTLAPAASSANDLEAPEPRSNTTPAEYMAMVQRAKDYITAGDAFQIVLSQRFTTPFTLPPVALYRALRRTTPSPFLFYLEFGDFALVGSSPEILVRVRDGEVTIRPIAGTARRGATRAEDEALAEALLADPKERAEHLIDRKSVV